MKKNDLVLRLGIITLLIFSSLGLSLAQNFNILNSWDFEEENLGTYTESEMIEDFNPVEVVYFQDEDLVDIVVDEINGASTKVMQIKNRANECYHGFGMRFGLTNPRIDFEEIYVSYNWKFSEEFNSTAGGKIPGIVGLPRDPDQGPTCPDPGYGFSAHYMFKRAGSLISYHYDRTDHDYDGCPWATVDYDYDTIFFNNGSWYNITTRLVMNTYTDGYANADGIKETWVDGRLIFQETNLILMEDDSDTMKIDAFRIANFYGGDGETYSPKSACWGYIDNLIVWMPNYDPVEGNEVHDPSVVLNTPAPITNRLVYYDKLITEEGSLKNSQYGNVYSSCIDETYLIDAGGGNTVTFNWSHTIGVGDYLFFYDGNKTDSKILKIYPGYSSKTNQQITSSGRYLFIRFSTDTDLGTTGWSGNISFNYDSTHVEEPNNPPVIKDQKFLIHEEELADNYIGKIVADDNDEGQEISFSILQGNESGLFSLESGTGDLSVTQQNVFDLPALEYNLLVQAKDNGEVAESSTANVNVVFVPETPEPDPIPTVYIDPGNTNDNLEDGSSEHPFNSWSDVSWEEGYQYLQKRGTTSDETKISIYAGNVTLGAYGEGDKPVIQSNSEESAVKFFNKTGISIQYLHIIAEKAISCIYIYGEESDRNLVENCTLEGAENGIRAIDGKSVTICYNTITNCTDAIYSYAEDNSIYYNVFKFNIQAINITSLLSGSKIYNNVFYENGTGVSNSYSDLTLHNNIFYLASAGDIAINQKMDELLSNNNIFYPEREGFIAIGDYSYSSLAEFQENKGLDMNSFCHDPLFVDVYNDNFDLEYNSPAIDAGTMVGLEFDFLGNHVPLGGAPDIGIIEKSVNGTTANQYSLSDNKENVFSVFPNPTSGRVNVLCKEVSGQPGDLYIKDITGKTVYMGKFYSHGNNTYQTIDISDLPGELYVLFIQFTDKLYSHRILRMH